MTVSPRGCASLEPDDPGHPNVFVHFFQFKEKGLAQPRIGNPYSYAIKQGQNGPMAIDLALAD